MNSGMEDALQSTESLDRASPDLWPDHRQNGNYAVRLPLTREQRLMPDPPSPPLISDEFTPQDAKLFHEYANLTPAQMIEEVKQLQNVAYLLGLDEAKEMRRGKYLNILKRCL